jgi:CheY-like chemotaxis protein
MRSFRHRFILHIEDDEDDRNMLKEAVKEAEASLDVWMAKDGKEGMEILMQCSLLNNLPALIILDLNMPGMDGKKVLREIKSHPVLCHIPVVLFTTSSSELDKIFASKEGVKIFTKPSVAAEFFIAVKNMIETTYRMNEK